MFFGVFILTLAMNSCGVNSNVMFKEAKSEETKDSIPMFPSEDYRISADDKISFTLSTNNGKEIIEKLSGISETATQQTGTVEYLVRRNGFVELPVIGQVKVAELTVEACEDTLVKLYSKEYIDPFVQLRINASLFFPVMDLMRQLYHCTIPIQL